MSVISMKQLLEAGVHFGHQTRRWNPKMAEYIYTERNGIYIIDLQKSVGMVDDAYKAVSDIVADGGTILFVGTKKQAQDAIQTEAERCGMFYVNERPTIYLDCTLPHSSSRLRERARARMCSHMGVASGRVYTAAQVAKRAGALLPHLSTIARPERRAVSSLLHYPWGHPRLPLAVTVPL